MTRTPNLDGMSQDDLNRFIDEIKADRFPPSVEEILIDYAHHKILSMRFRLAGNVDNALKADRNLDRLYASLPEQYKW